MSGVAVDSQVHWNSSTAEEARTGVPTDIPIPFACLQTVLSECRAMHRLGMPTMSTIYGAFAYTPLSEWPVYTRAGMYQALESGGYGPRIGFVAKPASDGTNFGLLVMTPERWKRENWSMPLVARHVERFLYKEKSSWGQWYEQRGVVIQKMYTDGAPRGLRWPHGLAEMNVLAHLGRPVHVRVMEIPKAHGTGCFDVRLHLNGSHECLPAPNCPNALVVCAKYALHFADRLNEVRSYVTRISNFFGADWFRFDYFYGHPARPIRINEISYPSHHTYPPDMRRAWVQAYADSVGADVRPSPAASSVAAKPAKSSRGAAEPAATQPPRLPAMAQVPAECVMNYILPFINVDPITFDKMCFLCRPSPPGRPPSPPSPPSPPDKPPCPPSPPPPPPPPPKEHKDKVAKKEGKSAANA